VNELPFEVTGEGEPVVVVPGFPFGGHAFRQLVPLLATRFRVLVADLSGFEERGSKAQAAAIRDRLRDLGIERAAFVAHGTGGRIAQALAFEEGTDVDAIVLLGTVGPTEGPVLPETAEDALARAHVEPLADADADAYLERWRRDPGSTATTIGSSIGGSPSASARRSPPRPSGSSPSRAICSSTTRSTRSA